MKKIDRKNTRKKCRITLRLTDLREISLEERKNSMKLKSITHSQVVQNVADRVYTAFKNFFDKKAKFPRIKQPKKYRSLTYPQSGFKINPERVLYLSNKDRLYQNLLPQTNL